MMSLSKRVAHLEQASPATKGFCISWTMPENTDRIECNGQEFYRQDGESLDNFTSRAASTALLAAAPGAILWMDAVF